MKPDWSKAPVDAEAGIGEMPGFYSAWYKRGGNGQVYQICPGAGVHSWCWMRGRVDFPAGSETRPVGLPLNNAHVEIPSVSGQELLLSALKDCVTVMEKELNGLAVIQPELMAAKAAIEACKLVDAEYAEWDGKGLPPVGTVCEFAGFNPEETLPSDPLIGDRVTVIAHFKSGSIDLAAFTFFAPPYFEYLQVAQGAYGCFRSIRTPEQIEDEKRQQAITEMLSFVKGDVGRDVLFDLYEAGYRKQVAP